METVISILYVAAVSWFAVWIKKKHDAAQARPEYHQELAEKLKRVAYLNDQLQAIEELLTDIYVSGPERLKNFTLSWNTAAGNALSADFFGDGQSEVTGCLRELAG